MERRKFGFGFFCISAFLLSSRYISAAIFGSNVTSWNSELFNAMLESIGNNLLIFSKLSLLIGAVYFILGEIEVIKNNKRNS